MYDLISSLKRSELFTAIDVLELIDEQSVKLIKIKAELSDGSLLYVTELHTDEYQRYSYHWQKANGELIIRWDNKPHWKNMKTFPHHRHDRDKVLPSHRITIDEVISELEKSLNQVQRIEQRKKDGPTVSERIRGAHWREKDAKEAYLE